MELKLMELKDLPQVLDIEKLSYTNPWSKASFMYEITENPLATYLVAREGDKVIGYGGIWIVLDEAHITTLAVHPAYRRNGVGKSLLNALLDVAKNRKVRNIILEVRASNFPAQNLYQKFGFKPIGIRKKYYSRPEEDAIVMSLELKEDY
ncbi:ribosomal protein S18-alanine N-acetyltransferase [Carboxydothermus ferrireducens]|uniref:[Ribosomal protein bS18]-alanine N-acetyltransferase n=1 Tax=Carboxydothermus ferrireducens DSM 11255 TaxID=1119529 RepID=A0ABX2R8X1_9THEO|nr:ribosomal protein S18-alanine N-acetyltransferase [Carboxydothermus ferrireducens]NYE56591.1 ribosomal-protein-alanine N-acetyltransferase [Carboxydothermus ferrireducens DSM 11255]